MCHLVFVVTGGPLKVVYYESPCNHMYPACSPMYPGGPLKVVYYESLEEIEAAVVELRAQKDLAVPTSRPATASGALLGAPPLPRVLELAASKAAHLPAFDHRL